LAAAGPRCAWQRIKRAATKKRLDTAPRVRAIWVSYMACHNYHARTMSWPWARPLRAGLNKGGLKMEPAWESILSPQIGNPHRWGVRSQVPDVRREGLGLGRSGLAVRARQDITKGTKYIITYILPIKLNTPRFCKTKPISPLKSTNFSRARRIIDTKTWILQNEAGIPFRINGLFSGNAKLQSTRPVPFRLRLS
jgi:hypothetical protein